jgi:DNA-binding MarR family transcriptional regulator
LPLAVLDTFFADQPPTIGQAAAYGSSRQNVTQIARQLVDRGYLELEPDSADRPAVRLRMTAKKAVFDEPAVRAEQLQLLADMFGGLAPAEILAMRDLVARCLGHNATAADQPVSTSRGGRFRPAADPA